MPSSFDVCSDRIALPVDGITDDRKRDMIKRVRRLIAQRIVGANVSVKPSTRSSMRSSEMQSAFVVRQRERYCRRAAISRLAS